MNTRVSLCLVKVSLKASIFLKAYSPYHKAIMHADHSESRVAIIPVFVIPFLAAITSSHLLSQAIYQHRCNNVSPSLHTQSRAKRVINSKFYFLLLVHL